MTKPIDSEHETICQNEVSVKKTIHWAYQCLIVCRFNAWIRKRERERFEQDISSRNVFLKIVKVLSRIDRVLNEHQKRYEYRNVICNLDIVRNIVRRLTCMGSAG